MKKKRGQGVVKISDLFEKYKKRLKAPQATVVNNFIEVVEQELGYCLQKHCCTYSPNSKTLTLSVSGQVKTEIFLQKEHLLKELTKRIGEKNIPKQIL